jgi:hypothetical protein
MFFFYQKFDKGMCGIISIGIDMVAFAEWPQKIFKDFSAIPEVDV